MKAQKLPQDGIVLEVIENFQEIIWSKIALRIPLFMLNDWLLFYLLI